MQWALVPLPVGVHAGASRCMRPVGRLCKEMLTCCSFGSHLSWRRICHPAVVSVLVLFSVFTVVLSACTQAHHGEGYTDDVTFANSKQHVPPTPPRLEYPAGVVNRNLDGLRKTYIFHRVACSCLAY